MKPRWRADIIWIGAILQLCRFFAQGSVVGWGNNNSGQVKIPADLTNVIAISAGSANSLALTTDGSLISWGDFWKAPLGLSNVVAISSGADYHLALTEEGRVAHWGNSLSGKLLAPKSLTNAVAISSGAQRCLALTTSGQLLAWGSTNSIPPPIAGNVVAIATGGTHDLALTAEGRIIGWGVNLNGQLTPPEGLSNAVAIAAGTSHSLALTTEGRVVAWGKNDLGQTTIPEGLSNVVAISAAGDHSVALKANGQITTWGTGGFDDTTLPPQLRNVAAIAAGRNHNLALLSEGENTLPPRLLALGMGIGTVDRPFYKRIVALNGDAIYGAQGLPPGLQIDSLTGVITGVPASSGSYSATVSASNSNGFDEHRLMIHINLPIPTSIAPAIARATIGNSFELETVRNTERSTATGIPPGLSLNPETGLIHGTPLAVGDFDVTYTATNRFGSVNGSVQIQVRALVGWGFNTSGELDIPNGLAEVVSISAGGTTPESHCLALTSEGRVIAWGTNTSNQTAVPPGLSNVVAIAAGSKHSLALKNDGRVVAWGGNGSGQTLVPSDLSNTVAIAAGRTFSAALTSEGRVRVWGANGGRQTAVPSALQQVVAIAAGDDHCLALTTMGKVFAWGVDGPQLAVPADLSNVVAIAAGAQHSLALTAAGKVVAWGDRLFARLSVPPGLSNVVAIAAGGEQSLALTAEGTVVSWGSALAPGGSHVFLTPPRAFSNVVAMAVAAEFNLVLTGLPDGVAAPRFLAPQQLVATADQPLFWRVSAANGVQTFGVLGLPPGLAMDPSSGLISGNPLEGGSYSLTLLATNLAGVAERKTTLHVNVPLPSLTATGLVRALYNRAFSYSIGQRNATHCEASGLPVGLRIDPVSGEISGTPREPGDFPIEVSASNRFGSVTTNLMLRVIQVVRWHHYEVGKTNIPVELNNVIEIAAGDSYSLALTEGGLVFGWGVADLRQADPPAGLSNVVAIAAGFHHSLALTASGNVVRWGENFGPTTVLPAGLTNVVAIAAKGDNSLALTAEGKVLGWGRNQRGESDVPKGLSEIVAIAAGPDFSLALKANGQVVGWGNNDRGQITPPPTLMDAVAIAAGRFTCAALTRSGKIVAWGDTNLFRIPIPTGFTDGHGIAAGDDAYLALGSQEGKKMWEFGYVFPLGVGTGDGLEEGVAVALGSTSSTALLPTRNQCFTHRTIKPGSTVKLIAPVSIGQPARYEWYHNGTPVSQARTLTLSDVDNGQLGDYFAVSTFPFGRVTNTSIHLTFGPDLAVVDIQSPPEATGGSTQQLTWTTVNKGAESTRQEWIERIYLSLGASIQDDTLIAETRFSGPLQPGQSKLNSRSVSIPSNLPPSDAYRWIVVTEAAHNILEEDEWNNTLISKATMVLKPEPPLVLEIAPSTDGQSVALSFLPDGLHRYVAEFTDDLNSGTWETLKEFDVSEKGAPLSVSDTINTSKARFYRISKSLSQN